MVGFSYCILSVFGRVPGTGPGTPSDQDMEDLYTIRIGVDTGDSQAEMQSFAGSFRDLGSDVSQSSGSIHRQFQRINRYLGLLGINLSTMGMTQQFIKMDQVVRDFRKGMFEATREVSRGGGALLQWTEMSDQTTGRYMNIVAMAKEHWRRSNEEITAMFKNVAQSGVGAAANVEISSAQIEGYLRSQQMEVTKTTAVWAEAQLRMTAAIDEVADAVMLGFQLEFLGISAQQIQSLYHSMSVNLRMDMEGIREALYQVFVTSEKTSFAWQEHIRYVEQALARYSKLGVSIDDVSSFLLTMVERVRSAEGAFDRVGMVYELLMDRMGIRQQLGPTQQMRLFQMVSPEQLGSIIGDPGTTARTQFEANLQAGVGQLGPGRGFTTQDVLSRRLDPTQYLVVWQSMNEGMMNLLRLQAMQNVMGQIGPQGAEMMPIWAAQMPEFATFWKEFQAGLLLRPEGLRTDFQAMRDSADEMDRRRQLAEAGIPETQRGQDQFWGRVEMQMGKTYGLLEGWKRAWTRRWDQVWMSIRDRDYREASAYTRMLNREGAREDLRGAAVSYMLGAIPPDQEAADVLGQIQPRYMRQWVAERFGDVTTEGQRREAFRTMAADFATEMERFVAETPGGERAFQPLRFAAAGLEEGFLGLSLTDFMMFYRMLIEEQLPGVERLENLMIPAETQTVIEEATMLTRERMAATRQAAQRAIGPGAVGGGLGFEAISGDLYREWLQQYGVPAEIPLAPARAPDIEEPTSYIVPPVSYPGRRPRTTIEAMKEEALALGGGKSATAEPVVQVTAHLHMGPGQTITFDDAVTQVNVKNTRTRNIAGVREH